MTNQDSPAGVPRPSPRQGICIAFVFAQILIVILYIILTHLSRLWGQTAHKYTCATSSFFAPSKQKYAQKRKNRTSQQKAPYKQHPSRQAPAPCQIRVSFPDQAPRLRHHIGRACVHPTASQHKIGAFKQRAFLCLHHDHLSLTPSQHQITPSYCLFLPFLLFFKQKKEWDFRHRLTLFSRQTHFLEENVNIP